jgi:hypothetical protein
MKVTLRMNGVVQVFLKAERPIEHAFVAEMVERAAKGERPRLDAVGEGGGMVLSLGD